MPFRNSPTSIPVVRGDGILSQIYGETPRHDDVPAFDALYTNPSRASVLERYRDLDRSATAGQPITASIGKFGRYYIRPARTSGDGWARVLNLMRSALKIKKHDAIARSKTGWASPNHPLEYLFRYAGLGYTAGNNPQPRLFCHLKPPFAKSLIGMGGGLVTVLEFPNAKMPMIGEALQKLLKNPKLFKELREIEPQLLTLAINMITINNPIHDYSTGHNMKQQHIYLSA